MGIGYSKNEPKQKYQAVADALQEAWGIEKSDAFGISKEHSKASDFDVVFDYKTSQDAKKIIKALESFNRVASNRIARTSLTTGHLRVAGFCMKAFSQDEVQAHRLVVNMKFSETAEGVSEWNPNYYATILTRVEEKAALCARNGIEEIRENAGQKTIYTKAKFV